MLNLQLGLRQKTETENPKKFQNKSDQLTELEKNLIFGSVMVRAV